MKRSATNDRKPKRPTAHSGHVVACCSQEIDAGTFYHDYVARRIPVKIRGTCPIDIAAYRLDSIVQTLGFPDSAVLQVERKHGYGFGLGRARELMPFSEIVEKVRSGDDSYYLTTQYEDESKCASAGDGEDADSDDSFDFDDLRDDFEESEDGSDENEEKDEKDEKDEKYEGEEEDEKDEKDEGEEETDDEFDDYVDPQNKLTADDVEFRVKTLLQPPLTHLYKTPFPITPPLFASLITQQVNLWMGAQNSQAKKPDLLNPTTHALGKYIPAGNSSGLHHDHADNLYVLVEGRKRFTLYSPEDAKKLFTVGQIRKVYPNGLVDYEVNENAPFWRHMREDGAIVGEWAQWMLENRDFSKFSSKELQTMIDTEETHRGAVPDMPDPPSFSRVPPILAHLDELQDAEEIAKLTEFAQEHFPGFLQLRKLEVWLEPGEMLYLPCGWFHEVSSFATEKPGHVALNWWFVPPTKSDASDPYPDSYWAQDFAKTAAAIEHKRK